MVDVESKPKWCYMVTITAYISHRVPLDVDAETDGKTKYGGRLVFCNLDRPEALVFRPDKSDMLRITTWLFPANGHVTASGIAVRHHGLAIPVIIERLHIRALLQTLTQQRSELQRKKLAAIDVLARINHRLPVLETAIADCRRAVSHARPDRIAAEILAHIFTYALPNHLLTLPSADDAPISVARVCRYWREIALGTPQLWATMTLDFSRRPRYDENLWMARNARSISCFPSVHILGNCDPYHGFWSIIAPHIHRVRGLEICASPARLAQLLDSTAVSLHTLVLHYRTTPTASIFEREPSRVGAPNLKCLHISSNETPEPTPRLSELRLSFGNLTELSISEVFCHFSDFLEVLPSCFKLRILEVSLAPIDDAFWETQYVLSHAKTTLSHLRVLTLRVTEHMTKYWFLNHLIANLETLTLDCEGAEEQDFRALDSLSKFDTLQNLTISHEISVFEAEVFQDGRIAPFLPLLRTMRLLEHTSVVDPRALYKMPSDTFFPQLEVLEVEDADIEVWVWCALRAARFRGPENRLSLPTSGIRSLRSIILTQPQSRTSGVYDEPHGLPTVWQRRIAEFSAHGLHIQVDPFCGGAQEYYVHDEFPDSWPEEIGSEDNSGAPADGA
ncbi:hypothetical protein C8R44DRAFT_858444 [Mycena epipterygia]|nr:hypothetical protein C8R44DRAFT_858444 [Mycena epipterygia]